MRGSRIRIKKYCIYVLVYRVAAAGVNGTSLIVSSNFQINGNLQRKKSCKEMIHYV